VLVASGIVYSRDYAREFASLVAQIVPVLLLAAVVTPLRLGPSASDKGRALLDLCTTALLVGIAFVTEFGALFGVVAGGLSRHDLHLLERLLAFTALLALVRILTPLVRRFAAAGRISERRVWLFVAVTSIAGYLGAIRLFNTLD
jgi:hypothetical protein